MTPDLWDKVVKVFHAAVDLPVGERDAFLSKACHGDATWKREVENLLREEEDEESANILAESPLSLKSAGPAPPDIELGEIEHYTLVQKLGEGGMGSVFKAWDHRLDRLVALKFLSPRLYADTEMKARFLQEARTTSALDHPNICTIYGIEETSDGRLFISMAFYEGRTLRESINTSTLAPAAAINVVLQVAEGVAKAHSVGIIHRDLKPANVILTPEGLAKVLDFGIAKFGEGQGITKTGMTVGTVAYMSPEQARGKAVDQRTDIWAIGVLLYEMLTGHTPFEGENDLGVLYSIVHEEPKPINTTQTSWPAGLERVFQRALEKDADLRYQSVQDLIEDLEAVEAGRGVESEARLAVSGRKSPSVLVLPFANLCREADYEYFGDGLTEELINALSQVEDLLVVSRTTAFQFKGQASDVREIGRKLKVSAALEGSVRASGNRVRITVRLVNVADGYQLWSQRYDRELDDIFAVQDEIAQMIVDTLQHRLRGQGRKTLVRKPTEDKQAYDLYLKGRHHCNNWTQTGLVRGIELFEEALQRDREFVQAQAGLAEAYLVQGYWSALPPKEAWARVREAADQALATDKNYGEAYASKAAVLAVADWNWAGAKNAFERSIELNPKEPWSRYWYAVLYLVPHGRIEEAAEETRRSLELDPLSPVYCAGMAWFHFYAGRYDDAVRQAADGIELAPTFLENHWILAAAELHRGDVNGALRALEKAYAVERENSFTLALLVQAMTKAGRDQEAYRFLLRLESLRENRYASPMHLAWARLALGQMDAVFECLDRAVEAREVMVLYLGIMRVFEPIRDDPRTRAILAKIGLGAS